MSPSDGFEHHGPAARYRRPAWHAGTSVRARLRRSEFGSVEIIAVGAVLTLAVLIGIVLADRRAPDEGGSWNPAALPPVPVALSPSAVPVPVSVRPAPSPSPSTRSAAPRTPQPSRKPVTPSRRPSAPPAPPAPRPVLPVGARVGLEAVDTPGALMRHRDFRVGIDRIGGTDRADSTFVVRRGLGRSACASLEAGNVPGRFVRHRNFEMLLERRDGSGLFDADATFCAEPAGPGGRFVLRSVNYPDRYVAEERGRLRLSRVPASAAEVFRSRTGS